MVINMKSVKDILFELDLIVPQKYKFPDDNCGLLIGDSAQLVTACILALDVTNNVIDIAKKQKAELIITHHPVIFDPLRCIKSNTIVHRLIRNNISVICIHSQLDVADGGVNTVFANMLSLTGIKPIKRSDGMGRMGRLKSDLLGIDLARFAKTMLGSPSAQVVNGQNLISSVGVLGGSGGDYIQTAFENGVDAFITGEVKHSDYIYAINSQKTLITLGHHYSEVHILNSLKAKLKTVLNEVVFIVEEKYDVTEV